MRNSVEYGDDGLTNRPFVRPHLEDGKGGCDVVAISDIFCCGSIAGPNVTMVLDVVIVVVIIVLEVVVAFE